MIDARPPISFLLSSVRRRWRAVTAMRVGSLGAASAGLVLACALTAEVWLRPESFALVLLWSAAVAAAPATAALHSRTNAKLSGRSHTSAVSAQASTSPADAAPRLPTRIAVTARQRRRTEERRKEIGGRASIIRASFPAVPQ